MMAEFEMTDLGLLSYYLGIEVCQKEDFITVKQSSYAKKVLEQFGMAECNPSKFPMEPRIKLSADKGGKPADTTTYRRMIGCLQWRTQELNIGCTWCT